MLEIVLCLILHCVMSFVLKYCYDKEIIWHDNEEAPHLSMPKLYDLDKNCTVYDQQKYVENVIIPANDYFSDVSDIKASQNHDELLEMVAWAPTFLLVVNAFRKTLVTSYTLLNVFIGIGASVLITVTVSFIYNRTKFKLDSFQLSVAEIKEKFEYIRRNETQEFKVSDENALNNFIIDTHHSYIVCVKYTIDKRYQVKKVVQAITGLIYVLFIMRIPY